MAGKSFLTVGWGGGVGWGAEISQHSYQQIMQRKEITQVDAAKGHNPTSMPP